MMIHDRSGSRRPMTRRPFISGQITRRQALAGAAALAGTAALSVSMLGRAAVAAPRANPMPDELRRALEDDPRAPVLGNPRGNVTLTEFFDYNCTYCRKMLPTMQKLIAADPDLRVVLRELPVFGEGSYFAARASLASTGQGRYPDFHRALLSMRGQAEEASVIATATRIGLDVARLRKDMEQDWIVDQLATTLELADHMSLMGTPSFIAGDEAVFGAMSLGELQGLVTRGRAALG